MAPEISHSMVYIGPILTVCPGLWGGGEGHWREPIPEKKWNKKAGIQEWWGANDSKLVPSPHPYPYNVTL